MFRRFVISVVLALAGCSGGGAPDNDFYLRFEPFLNPGGPIFVGDFRALVWKDRVFQSNSGASMEMLTEGTREIPVGQFTPLGDTLFGLQNGKLVSSTDSLTFTDVTSSTQGFNAMGGGDGVLVALRSKGIGVAELFVSKDQGANWTQLMDVDAGFTTGTGGSVHVSLAVDGKVVISVGVYDDSFGNVDYAGQAYEFTLASSMIALVSSTKDKSLPGLPPQPQFKSKEGIAFFVDPNETVDQQGDATNVKVMINPPYRPELKGQPRLRWARPLLPYDASSSVVVLGVDSSGRLLVASDKVYRSVNALKTTDERAQILKGPGCEGRHTWTPDLKNDDQVEVTFENKTGKKVMLRQIDNQMRWQRVRELEIDETVQLNKIRSALSRQNVRLMVSDPADDTCLGVYVVPMADKSTLTAR
jgi:hypothetical protein